MLRNFLAGNSLELINFVVRRKIANGFSATNHTQTVICKQDMIETIAQFIEEFKAKGLDQIQEKDSDIKHTVTIGDIYEGLTSKILERSIFKGLNLRIVKNSFIYNDNGDLSKEMDCMIVLGEGKEISFTKRYKYHIQDVIAVIQVKKKLYKDSLDDAHQNLKSVIDTAIPREGESYMGKIHYDSYKSLVVKELPSRDELNTLPWREQMMYHFLQLQSFWPIRILIGYDSYKTEFKLREGFVEHMEKLLEDGPISGYSPISFPDLMICGKNSIIKNIGMPFAFPLQNDSEFYWDILTTSPERPMYYLLEFIWTRLSYKFDIGSEIFGDDFKRNGVHPFLRCRERKMSIDKIGWDYSYNTLSHKRLSEPLSALDWEPINIELFEQVILTNLISKGEVTCDFKLEKFCNKYDSTTRDLVNKWTKNRIAYRAGNKIILLLEEPITKIGQDGLIYVGENKSGEMMNWLNKKASI